LGLEAIHKKGVVHADLKPSNILLKGRDYDITITDFGISQKLPKGTKLANQFVGSMAYCSPEVLLGEPFNSKADIWALGCILYELCCTMRAFEDTTEEGLRQKILSFRIPQIPLHSQESRPSLKNIAELYQLCMKRV
jgi:NIMA (never in mitosis gene a)-related kinase